MKERKKESNKSTLATYKPPKRYRQKSAQGRWGLGSDEPTQALLQSYKHEIKVHFGPYTLDPKTYNL